MNPEQIETIKQYRDNLKLFIDEVIYNEEKEAIINELHRIRVSLNIHYNNKVNIKRRIIKLILKKVSIKEIALKFNVSTDEVYSIKHSKCWN